jgi:hypothetical protein
MHFPFGSESHDYLGYFIVQCVPDIQLSEIRQAFSQLANALQSGNLSAAVGVITCSPGDWAFCAGACANR